MFSCKVCGEPCTWLICDECKSSKNQHIAQRREKIERDPNQKPTILARIRDWVSATYDKDD